LAQPSHSDSHSSGVISCSFLVFQKGSAGIGTGLAEAGAEGNLRQLNAGQAFVFSQVASWGIR